ncbi:hypothetical protein C8J57DRAFT_1260076 [Mycena rebaudengoi]|nr:hypothetical protein C8J57DRAFT_1260076 [Mycena rebaudengoi]
MLYHYLRCGSSHICPPRIEKPPGLGIKHRGEINGRTGDFAYHKFPLHLGEIKLAYLKFPRYAISPPDALPTELKSRTPVAPNAAAGTTVGTTNSVESSENLTSGIGEAAEATSSSIPAKRKAPVASRAKPAKLQKKSK